MTDKDRETPATSQPPQTTPPGTHKSARASGTSLASGLALILSVVALLASAYLGYTFIEKRGIYRADMFSRLDKLEDASERQQESQVLHTQQITTLTETQDTLQTGMDKVLNEFGKGRGDWLLAETEQLMMIANHRLQLAHDIHLALQALRAADRQLHQLANPRYLPVRKRVAEEIAQLESLESIDLPGMSLRLGSLGARIDQLPFTTDTKVSAEERAHANQLPENKSAAREIWTDITSLIRIRRSSEMRKPLLPPEQQYFLRENLRLMLFGAQTALLQGDTATFEQNIKTADDWIRDYYDTSAPPVRAARAELDQMKKVRLSTRLPDISESLDMLRKLSGKKAES
jgi:uncharacterized protein HemX